MKTKKYLKRVQSTVGVALEDLMEVINIDDGTAKPQWIVDQLHSLKLSLETFYSELGEAREKLKNEEKAEDEPSELTKAAREGAKELYPPEQER